MREVRPGWPAGCSTAWMRRDTADPIAVTLENGLAGNGAGFPSHIEDSRDRAALVFNELTYQHLLTIFPQCTETFVRGGFSENFVVNSPDLLPNVVCIGDIFRVGTALFELSGPRFPCPKVDAWHNTSGLKTTCMENGWGGYFLRVLSPGVCKAGDQFDLISRKHPGFTVERISRALWGPEDTREHSVDFLTYVVEMPELMERRYKDTAQTRLSRLKKEDGTE